MLPYPQLYFELETAEQNGRSSKRKASRRKLEKERLSGETKETAERSRDVPRAPSVTKKRR
jgi:hypothetical protein